MVPSLYTAANGPSSLVYGVRRMHRNGGIYSTVSRYSPRGSLGRDDSLGGQTDGCVCDREAVYIGDRRDLVATMVVRKLIQ